MNLVDDYPDTNLSFMTKFYIILQVFSILPFKQWMDGTEYNVTLMWFFFQIAYWVHAFPELYFQKVKRVSVEKIWCTRDWNRGFLNCLFISGWNSSARHLRVAVSQLHRLCLRSQVISDYYTPNRNIASWRHNYVVLSLQLLAHPRRAAVDPLHRRSDLPRVAHHVLPRAPAGRHSRVRLATLRCIRHFHV